MVKVLMVITIVVVGILFAFIIREIDKAEVETEQEQEITAIGQRSAGVTDNRTGGVETATMPGTVQHPISQKTGTSPKGAAQAVERNVPAAFGYMERGERVQVVGVMSDLDRNGTLMRYIAHLCKEKDCDIDVGYQTDVVEAVWQKDIEALLKLFASGAIAHGALFVEADRVKIEGEAGGAANAEALRKIVAALSGYGFKVQNRVVLPDVADVASGAIKEGNETASDRVQQSMGTHAVSQTAAKALSQEAAAKETNATGPTGTVAQHAASETSKVVAPKSKLQKPKRIVHKRRVVKKAPKAPVEDIIAPSYMETTADLHRKIVVENGNLHERPKPRQTKSDDIVAKPKMEILR